MVEVLQTVYVMEGVSTEHIYSNAHARQIFEDLDKDGDGQISLEEFVGGCMKDEDFMAVLSARSEKIESKISNIEDDMKMDENSHNADLDIE